MTDSSNVNQAKANPIGQNNSRHNDQTEQSIFAQLHNPPSTTSSRSKKTSSAPTSVLGLQQQQQQKAKPGHARRASATVIFMDDSQNISNLANANFVNDNNTRTNENYVKNEESPSTSSSPQQNHHQQLQQREFQNSSPPSPPVSKIPLVSRLLPSMSRKNSQIVPSCSDKIPLEEFSTTVSLNDREGVIAQKIDEILLTQNSETASECQINGITLNAKKTDEIGNETIAPKNVSVQDGASTESFEDVCRICHDNTESRMTLLSPCLCKGSMGKVHRKCLERWLGESAKTSCEICGHEYVTERRPRYKGWRSVVAWIRNPLHPTDTRNLFFDLACFFILTPLAAISAWLCVVGAKTLNPEGTQSSEISAIHEEMKSGSNQARHHKLRKNVEASNSTWTSVGLLTLTGTLLAAYYVWLFVAARYHIQVWREWQSRNFVVTIVNNPDRIRQLREEAEVGEGAGGGGGENQGQGVEPQRNTNTNANINKNNTNNSKENPSMGSDQSNSSSTNNNNTNTNNNSNNNNNDKQKKLREKALARAYEETSSIGTISISRLVDSSSAGPSHNYQTNNNSDVDSIQGKIFPSQSSLIVCDIDNKINDNDKDGDTPSDPTTTTTNITRVKSNNNLNLNSKSTIR